MAAKPTMLTAEGLKKLEDELVYLQNEKRKEIAEKIKVARSFGDLSENSEYDDAKNEQAIMEARISTIEAILKTAVLIDESETSNERVHLTSVVKIEMLATGRQVQYKIVGSGSNEANPREGKISDESPIGAALMDKSVGDVVEVETPSGVIGIKILEITK
ncbi:transcription elongation factor GreA [Ruminococcus sp.]|uniref:transcription elongation factor GreA n=1 Tax=Ruminococcus sp. TaxID=41978 RepID=UPI002E76C236|nr:transcription elongation factor GreA [Ruminococcus sp.]MEE1264277.1 transcription elongation factor GreA [Ruminococcus sp.]